MPPINPLLAAVVPPPIPLAHAWAARYDGRHGPLLDFCQAVPGYPPHPEFLARSAAAAADPANARYGLIPGDLALREAHARDLSTTYAGSITPDQTAITAGCNQAFVVALMTLAQRGDSVLLPTPWFWNHQQSCAMLGIEPRALPCRPEAAFIPDADEAESLIDATTRAILLITPNNPTGAVYPAETIARFHALCAKHNLALILDETYKDFLPQAQARAHDLFQDPAWPAHLIQIYSFSKAYCIPGHRIGSLVADAAFIAQATKILDCLHICPQRAAQSVLAWAIPALQDWRAQNRATINARAATVAAALETLPAWRLDSLGAYFAYLHAPAAKNAEHLATTLGILALPGTAFGPGQDHHVRLAFANADHPAIREAARRLSEDGSPRF